MPTLPTNPHYVGDSGHTNDHNTTVTALSYLLTDYQTSSKNKVINGNFMVNQRAYASAANLASGTYGFDRWKSNYTNTTLTFTSAPQGQSVTINSAGGLQQVIERSDIPAGSYTLSWVGTATGRVYNSGATAPSYSASPITVTLDGTANVVVEFTASGGTKTLSQVQLERGTWNTAYEFEDYGTTLRKCQRFFMRWNVKAGAGRIGAGYGLLTTQAGILLPYQVTPRDYLGTLSVSAAGDFNVSDGTTGTAATSIARYDVTCSEAAYSIQANVASGLTVYRGYWLEAKSTATAWVSSSMEL